ncbi:MAG: hypothetical protein K1563_07845 [Candidatus Thiodiazotropha sp. (ex. Lucinisca nassula)]|nr:hypothetical protein [Candidatus Thiodiazotropha sp. (ex. Lucinisca nassula)]MBW9273586.1 hypothetical protein [Candidatus Thiodiazotropha sp. (ex. Lucinisca nassula)]
MSLYDQIARGFNPLQGLENAARMRLQGQQLKQQLAQAQDTRRQKSLYDQLRLAETQRLNQSTIDKNRLTMNKDMFDIQASVLGSVKTPAQFEAAKIRLAHLGTPLPEGVTFENMGSYADPKAAKFGTSVHYGTLGNETIAYQVSNDGTLKLIDLPGGAKPARPISFHDIGGSLQGYDPISGETVVTEEMTIPPEKEISFVEESSQAKAEGKSRGEDIQDARNNLGKSTQQANYSIQLLEQLKNHPGLPYATGIYSVMPRIPGTAQADFIARVEQLQGATFLQAYQQLKGGGHITEIEGEKAQNAVARMQRSQSKEEFIKAADEYIGIIKAGLQRMRAKAQGNKQATIVEAPPAAIDYLKQNPDTKNLFIQKYRYLPEGL